MEVQINLAEEDIKQVLANYYEVELNKVELRPSITTKGYGMDEHEEATVTAIIKFNNIYR